MEEEKTLQRREGVGRKTTKFMREWLVKETGGVDRWAVATESEDDVGVGSGEVRGKSRPKVNHPVSDNATVSDN